MVLSDWTSICRGMKLDSYFIPHAKSISKHTKVLNVKSKISLSLLYPRVPRQCIQLMSEQKIYISFLDLLHTFILCFAKECLKAFYCKIKHKNPHKINV